MRSHRRGRSGRSLAAALAVTAALLAARPQGARAAPAEYRGLPVARVVAAGLAIEGPIPPVQADGRTMVPLGSLAEALGIGVRWDATGEAVHLETRTGQAPDAPPAQIPTGPGVAPPLAANGPAAVRVFVDGQPVTLEIPPIPAEGDVLVPLRPIAQALGATVRWEERTGTAFVYAPGQDPTSEAVLHRGTGVPPALARELARALDTLWQRVAGDLGLTPAGPTPEVWLFRDRDEWYRHLLDEGAPDTAARRTAGHADGNATGEDHVHVRVPDTGVPDGETRVTLLHEFGHVALNRRGLAGRLPAWVAEGLVEAVARRLEGHLPATPQGSRWRGALRKEVLESWLEGRRAGLISDPDVFFDRFAEVPAHAEAALAVDRLEQQWGPDALTRYVDAVAAGDDPAAAFETVFGTPAQAFEADLAAALRTEARRRPRLQVAIDLPAGARGTLTAYGPGARRSDVWAVSGEGRVTVSIEPGGAVSVSAPRRPRYYGRLDEPAPGDGAFIFWTPDRPLEIGGRRLKAAGFGFELVAGQWAWAGTVLHWATGDPEVWSDPATPAGPALVEVTSAAGSP